MYEDEKNKFVEKRARKLAKKYCLEITRVEYVLHELQSAGWYGRFDPEYTAFEEALNFVRASKALEIFENVDDLIPLQKKVRSFSYLFSGLSPLYSLADLSSLMMSFKDYFVSNRKHLLQTGYPIIPFMSSPWFELCLNKIYFVKLPLADPLEEKKHSKTRGLDFLGQYPTSYISKKKNKRGRPFWRYKWAEESPFWKQFRISFPPIDNPGYLWIEGGALSAARVGVYECKYEKAAFIPDLEQQELTYLQKIRETVFNLKLHIIERLATALRDRDMTDLRRDCLDYIKKFLHHNDVRFLLGVDFWYTRITSLLFMECSEEYKFFIRGYGSLSDLIKVIGHCEKEISIGTMHKMACKLPHFMKTENPPISYFQFLKPSWEEELDQLLDEFDELMLDERDFWEDFEWSINETFENELGKGSVLNYKLQTRLSTKFRSNFNEFGDWSKEYREITEGVPISYIHEHRSQKFRHTPRYKTVFIRENKHELKRLQPKVIQYLHEAYKNGEPWVTQKELKEFVFGKKKEKKKYRPKLNRIFLKNEEALKDLITFRNHYRDCRLRI